MPFPYTKRYAGGFADLPAKTTAIDSAFLNAVEAALIALCGTTPSADYVPVWNAVDGKFEPAKIANAQISTTAAIAISKLAGFPNDVTKALLGDGTWATLAAATGVDGWSPVSAALTYSSADAPTFVATTASDLTSVISIGARLKLTQSAAVKYFIVTAISSTTITLYGGQNYTLANSAISAVSYSHVKGPQGFPLDPTGWTEQLKDTSSRSQGSPVAGTWYNPSSLSLSLPIGAWNAEYEAAISSDGASGTGDRQLQFLSTLSTANNSASDVDWTAAAGVDADIITASTFQLITSVTRRKPIVVTVKTSYFLNICTTVSGVSDVAIRGDLSPTIIRALCSYL